MKAIDWYLICCFLFVFGVLVEYTIVLYLDNVSQRKRKQRDLQKRLNEQAKAEVYIQSILFGLFIRIKKTKQAQFLFKLLVGTLARNHRNPGDHGITILKYLSRYSLHDKLNERSNPLKEQLHRLGMSKLLPKLIVVTQKINFTIVSDRNHKKHVK